MKVKRNPSVPAILAAAILFAFITGAVAAPYHGDEYRLGQPDGSEVPVILWGDEFHTDAESPDGYTLIRGADGWICYAGLSADGSEYVSTGVRYTGGSRAPGSQKKIRISQKSMAEKHRRNREALGFNPDELVPRDMRRQGRGGSYGSDGMASAPEVQKVVGLTLLVDFPDMKSVITRATVDDFCNRVGGVGGTSSAGSIYDYFSDVSNGLMEYTNIVLPFVTADSNMAFYDQGTGTVRTTNVRTLITDALNKLNAMNIDVSGVTTEGNTAVALNIFYAGARRTWSEGLWPHQGTYSGGATLKGISFNRYQITDLGLSGAMPSIGTFVHENGHMVMRWDDLYNYDNTVTNVVSTYCIMSSTTGLAMPNPYYRDLAGWISVTDINNTNATLTHVANSHTAYRYQRPGSIEESYYIEARRRVGRSANIPGEGLLIWHVHTNGYNRSLQSTRPYPMVKIVQANNAASTTTAFPATPTANAPFRADGGSNNTSFSKATSPAARYYGGVMSEINITDVSAPGASMTFKVSNGVSGDTYFAGGDGSNGNPFLIATAAQLAKLAELVNAGNAQYNFRSYKITADVIDLSAYGEGAAAWNSGKGWIPIGLTSSKSFLGTLDGNGKKITGLYISDAALDSAGLFGHVIGGTVKNLGVEGGSVAARRCVGGVAGYITGGNVENCYYTGSVSGGGSEVGGVVGYFSGNGNLANCYSTGSVSGTSNVGGVVGNFAGRYYTNGAMGAVYLPGSMENCYSTGNVSGTSYIGGVAGYFITGGMENCYSLGSVTGTTNFVGGVVGYLGNRAGITGCYSAGGVTGGSSNVGGVLGYIYASTSSISYCAALNPHVRGGSSASVGRVVGNNAGTITGNIAFGGMSTNGGPAFSGILNRDGESRTAASLQAAAGFPAALTGAPWVYAPGSLPGLGAPVAMPAHLRIGGVQQITGATVTVGGTYTYSGSPQVPTAANLTVTLGGATLARNVDYTDAVTNNTNAGTATVTVTGTGNYAGTATGSFTIGKKPVTITGLSASNKVFDGGTSATVTGTAVLSGVVGTDNVTVVAGTAAFADSSAGSGKAVMFSGYSIGGTAAGNYALSAQPASVTANITKAPASALTAMDPEKFIIPADNTSAQTFNLGGIVLTPTNHGVRSYELGALNNASGLLDGSPTLSGTTLTYRGSGLASGTATQIIIIKTNNYEDKSVTLTFETSQAKESATVTVTAPAGIMYGTALGNPSASASGSSGGSLSGASFVYTYVGVDVPYSSADKPAGVGAYVVKAALDNHATHSGEGVSAEFRISPRDLTASWFTVTGEYTYNAAAHEPDFTVSGTNYGLSKGDVDVRYENNVDAGTASVFFKGKGNFGGEVSRTFTIGRKAITVNADGSEVGGKVYDGTTAVKAGDVSVAFDGLEDGQSFKLGNDYAIQSAAFSSADAGSRSVSVTVSLVANGPTAKNYSLPSGSFTKSGVTIDMKEPEVGDLTFTIPEGHRFNGNAQGIGPVSGKPGMGVITVLYNGIEDLPADPGVYAVTVVIEGGSNYTIGALTLGNYTIADAVSILANNRVIPGTTEGGASVVPSVKPQWELTAGPNPASKGIGKIDFYHQGGAFNNGVLTIYDALGNLVRKIDVTGTGARGGNLAGNIAITDTDARRGDHWSPAASTRTIGSWDLKDAKGRQVPDGTYLVRGVLKSSDGSSRSVSLIIGVR